LSPKNITNFSILAPPPNQNFWLRQYASTSPAPCKSGSEQISDTLLDFDALVVAA